MELDKHSTLDNYMEKVVKRLHVQGFKIGEKKLYKSIVFDCIAKRTAFEIEKFGFVTTYFLFSRFSSVDNNSLKAFSAQSFRYANRGIHPPCGLLYSIVCFPVAIVDTVDFQTAEAVRRKTPPKHWAAFEMPVVFDVQKGALYYSEITPQWGRIYYDGLRTIIVAMLSP